MPAHPFCAATSGCRPRPRIAEPDRPWGRVLAGLALALVLAGCGGGEPSGRDGRGAGERVAPEHALAEAPVQPAGGVPITADDDHLWLSDHEQLAVYSRHDQQWRTTELPWDRELLSSLKLVVANGELVGLAILCPSDCALVEETVEAEQAPVLADVVPFVLEDRPGEPLRIRELDLEGEAPVAIASVRSSLPSTTDGAARVLVDQVGTPALFTLTPERAQVETGPAGGVVYLCPSGDGWVAVERVAHDAEGAVPWAPLPEGWEQEPDDAWRIVGGAELRAMQPMDVPEALRSTLADRVGQAFVCVPDGSVALVGASDAWELRDGRWVRAGSTVGDVVMGRQASQSFETDDGRIIATTVDGTLTRSPDGEWGLRGDAGTSNPVVVMGDLVLEYHRPEAPSGATG